MFNRNNFAQFRTTKSTIADYKRPYLNDISYKSYIEVHVKFTLKKKMNSLLIIFAVVQLTNFTIGTPLSQSKTR